MELDTSNTNWMWRRCKQLPISINSSLLFPMSSGSNIAPPKTLTMGRLYLYFVGQRDNLSLIISRVV